MLPEGETSILLYALHKIITNNNKISVKNIYFKSQNHNRSRPQLPFTSVFQTTPLKTKYYNTLTLNVIKKKTDL